MVRTAEIRTIADTEGDDRAIGGSRRTAVTQLRGRSGEDDSRGAAQQRLICRVGDKRSAKHAVARQGGGRQASGANP